MDQGTGNDWQVFLEWLSKVVAAAGLVLGTIWRFLDGMITRKVQAQIAEAMKPVTEATSKAIDELRNDIKRTSESDNARAEERTEGVTKRIDELFSHLMRGK